MTYTCVSCDDLRSSLILSKRLLAQELRVSLGSMNFCLIEPGRAEKNYRRDLWRYRELFYQLAGRDVAVRYKQTCFYHFWLLHSLPNDQYEYVSGERLFGASFCSDWRTAAGVFA